MALFKRSNRGIIDENQMHQIKHHESDSWRNLPHGRWCKRI
ncbi:hypothetical protein PUNNY_80 [Escherichia phage_vB_EcoD_Punny]|nr:hypothetical protein PUNNY_80 [Escherichia phage_vB_EcoD_Punny]